jgi:hypothetical protein
MDIRGYISNLLFTTFVHNKNLTKYVSPDIVVSYSNSEILVFTDILTY